jgi:hypothetical protein
MDYEELFEKYQTLLMENNNLKDEIIKLKAQLGIEECQIVSSCEDINSVPESEMPCTEPEKYDTLSLLLSLFRKVRLYSLMLLNAHHLM